jgi:hypothetical protein
MGTIWELDFYSRPVLDERDKKRWEVLISESPLQIDQPPESLFRYSQFCANTEVNSVWLRQAVEAAIAQAPTPPDRIRFFRRQMANMITKACEEAGVPAYPSRRTIALSQWLEQRMAEVYPAMPNYKPSANPSVNLGDSIPQRLPDALVGQQWAFVTLEASAFQEFGDWAVDFGEVFSFPLLNLAPETRIPGLLVFSPRALPLAAWMSGLELAFVKPLPSKPPVLALETGASESWILANLTTPDLQTEAANFEAAKQQARGVHFLATQTDPEADAFTGFWLMQELNLA